MSIPADLMRENPALGEWSILLVYRGSIAHGTYIPNSDPLSIDDKDVMGLCVPPPDHYLGLNPWTIAKGTKEIKRDEWDIVLYELRKGMSLLEAGNPNVLTLLWSEPNTRIKVTPPGQHLIANRHIFVGRHVYRPFVGYAISQLHKMTRFQTEGYMGARRKELMEKFGYDTKNAAHLIRLLRMGIEYMKDGELYVNRHDAPQLLEIKHGEWTLEHVKAEADRLFVVAEQAFLDSKLPERPNHEAVSELCYEIVMGAFAERGYLLWRH